MTERVHRTGETVASVRERISTSLRKRVERLPRRVREALGDERYDSLTEKSKLAVALAADEGRRMGHNYIGTEHLLLGIVASNGLAGRLLAELEVGLDQVREAVEYVVGRGDQGAGDVGLTPRAKRALELGLDEARRLGQRYVGTEHLLLGLVVEGEGVAAGVLESIGAGPERVRAKVLELTAGAGYAPEAVGTKESVVTCRVDPADVWAMDVLVEAGIRSTRSDAAQWLIHAGIEANRGMFEQVQGTVAEIRRLREQARRMASGAGSSAAPEAASAAKSGGASSAEA